MATDEMKGLIAELMSNRWYKRLYFVQVAAWLTITTFYEVAYAPDASLLKHIIDGGVAMSFLAYGSLVSAIIVVDVVNAIYERGKELMGILITPARNKFEAQAEARGRRDMAVRSAEWFAQMQQAYKEGREFHKPPPWEEDEDRTKR